jgi:transporter family protein
MSMQRSTMYAILALLCFGIAPIFEKFGLKQAGPAAAVLVRATMTASVYAVVLWNQRGFGELKTWSPATWLSVILGAFFSVVLAQIFYFLALRGANVTRVIPLMGAYPVVSAIMAILLMGEKVTIIHLLGIILVTAGVVLLA